MANREELIKNKMAEILAKDSKRQEEEAKRQFEQEILNEAQKRIDLEKIIKYIKSIYDLKDLKRIESNSYQTEGLLFDFKIYEGLRNLDKENRKKVFDFWLTSLEKKHVNNSEEVYLLIKKIENERNRMLRMLLE